MKFICEGCEKPCILDVGDYPELTTDSLRCVVHINHLCKWKTACNGNAIKFACDTMSAFEPVVEAVKMVRSAGYGGEFSIYVLAKDVDDTLVRIEKLLALDKKLNPVVMPYRNLDGDGEIINSEIKKVARWCNRVAIRKSCPYKEYKEKLKEVAE